MKNRSAVISKEFLTSLHSPLMASKNSSIRWSFCVLGHERVAGIEEGWVGGEATAAPPRRKVLETVGFQGASRNLLEATRRSLPATRSLLRQGYAVQACRLHSLGLCHQVLLHVAKQCPP
jgi:hypothetical protein